MAVHAAGRQDHRHGRAFVRNGLIRQHNVRTAFADGVLGLVADTVERIAQGVFAAAGVEGAVDIDDGFAEVTPHAFVKRRGQHR